MRVISGRLKSRIIKVPNSDLIRPTTDKTRETIFNYLTNFINFDGAKVCDIYAGSGSLGIEAYSRGAQEIHFVEKDFKIQKNLMNNLEILNLTKCTKIYKMTALKFSLIEEHDNYNIIFADPPFFKNDIYEVIQNLLLNKFLTKEGFIILERSVQTEEEDIINLKTNPIRRLGDSLIYQFEYSNKLI